MFKHLFRRSRPMPSAIQNEILSMRHAQQMDLLALPPHLRRDIGIDQGGQMQRRHSLSSRHIC